MLIKCIFPFEIVRYAIGLNYRTADKKLCSPKELSKN